MAADYRRIKRVMDSQGGMPRIGKIRLGIKKLSNTGVEYPSEVDYFVLDPDLTHRDKIVAAYGEKPKKLLVMFLSDELEVAFPTAYKAYSSALGLVCKGDGVKANRVEVRSVKEPARGKQPAQERRVAVTTLTGERVTKEVECPCAWLEEGRCRAVGNLFVVMPEVALTSTYQIDTGSWHTMRNILAGFDLARAMTGRIRDVLFWLERISQETHGSGRTEVHFPLRLRMLEPEEDALYRDKIRARLAQYVPLLGGDVRYARPPELPGQIEEADIVRGQVVPDDAITVVAEPLADAVPQGEVGGDDQPDAPEVAPKAAGGAEAPKTTEQPKVRRGRRGAPEPAGEAAKAPAEPPKPAGPSQVALDVFT